MTSLSRTFSWIPHCWPQKQQCVLTSRSGSTLVERRTPVIDDRCGPKRSMIRRGSTGMVATGLTSFLRGPVVEVRAPQAALGEPEQRPTTPRAHLLVVPAVRQLVCEAELAFDDREVAHHRHRRERLM